MIVIFLLFILCIILIEKSTIAALMVCALIIILLIYQNKTVIPQLSVKESFLMGKYILEYVLILCINIVASNIHVAKIVLSPRVNIHPKMVAFKTQLKWDISKAVLANSITLTPGTLTVEVFEDTLMIHCLDEKFIDGLGELSFDKILLKIEGVYHGSNG